MAKGAIEKRLEEIKRRSDPKEIAKFAYDVWVRYTPKRSGNAKRKTELNGDEIHANYPYALRLDQGWSKQHGGVGMSKPTRDAVQQYIDKKI